MRQSQVELSLFSIRALPAWIVIASFGPYLSLDLRLQPVHFLLYPLVLLAFGRLLHSGRSLAMRPTLLVTWGLWLMIVLWMLTVTFGGAGQYGSIQKVLAWTENYTQPIAVLFAVSVIAGYRTPEEVLAALRLTCRTLLVMLVLNVAFAVASILTDVSAVAYYFVGEPQKEKTVWEVMVIMGRHSGVFAAAFPSGVAYSIGLLCWVWLYSQRRVIPITGLLFLGAIVAGGFLAITRAFIFVGLPLGIAYLVVARGPLVLVRWRTFLVAGPLVAVGAWLIARWTGVEKVTRLFNLDNFETLERFLRMYTSDRLTPDIFEGKGLSKSMMEIPLFTGVGLDSPIGKTIDIGFMEFFLQGGIVALALFLTILGVMLGVTYREVSNRSPIGWFLLFLFVMVVVNTFGGSVLTMNRTGSIAMTFVTLIFCFAALERRRPQPAPGLRRFHTATPAE